MRILWKAEEEDAACMRVCRARFSCISLESDTKSDAENSTKKRKKQEIEMGKRRRRSKKNLFNGGKRKKRENKIVLWLADTQRSIYSQNKKM